MVTIKSQTEHWKNEKGTAIIQSYFDSGPGIQRSLWFSDILKSYTFDSICEAGSFAGRNLYYIQKEFPCAKLYGFDVNKKAIEFSKKKVPGAEFWEMDIYNVGKCDKKFDIIYTSGTLIHLVPETISDVVKGMLSVANKYVMHIEECGDGEVVKGPKSMRPKKKVSDQVQWAPNIIKVYNDLGYVPNAFLLPEGVRTNGARELIIVKI